MKTSGLSSDSSTKNNQSAPFQIASSFKNNDSADNGQVLNSGSRITQVPYDTLQDEDIVTLDGSHFEHRTDTGESDICRVIQQFNYEKEAFMVRWTELQLAHADAKSFHEDELNSLVEVLKEVTIEKNQYKREIEKLKQEKRETDKRQDSSLKTKGWTKNTTALLSLNQEAATFKQIIMTGAILVAYNDTNTRSCMDAEPYAWLNLIGSSQTRDGDQIVIKAQASTWTLNFKGVEEAEGWQNALPFASEESGQTESLDWSTCEKINELLLSPFSRLGFTNELPESDERLILELVASRQQFFLAEQGNTSATSPEVSKTPSEEWKAQVKESLKNLQQEIARERDEWKMERSLLEAEADVVHKLRKEMEALQKENAALEAKTQMLEKNAPSS